MKKKLWLLLMTCLFGTKAMAGIGIFPQAVDFPENSRNRSQTVNIVNASKTMQTYRVSMGDFAQDENGEYIENQPVSNSAQKYLIYSPKQFTLMPGKTQAIRVARKNMGDAKDGEYVSHLIIKEVAMPNKIEVKELQNELEINKEKTETNDEAETTEDTEEKMKEISMTIRTLFATSVPVTIYKGNHLQQATEVISYKKNGDKLDLVLQRHGNISSRFNLKVLNNKKDVIGEVGPIRIYTPNGKRNLSVSLKSGTQPVKLELYDALSKKKISEKAL